MSSQNQKLIRSLLMILLLIPISATAQLNQQTIRTGEIAPFNGVIVPNETYAKMQADIYEKDYLRSQLDQCMDKPTIEEHSSSLESGALGFVLGFISTAAIISYMK